MGRSVKFNLLWRGRVVEAFVVNFAGAFYGYINYCIHAGTPLDWWPNEFFTKDGKALTCGTHGSRFDPVRGKCIGGPCAGGSLFPIKVEVAGGMILVTAP